MVGARAELGMTARPTPLLPTGHRRDVGLSDAGFVAYFSLLLPSLLILHGGLLLDHAFTYLFDRLSHMCLMPDTVASLTYVPIG